jgi:hypothetical protein
MIDLVESSHQEASLPAGVVGRLILPARIIARRIDDSYPLVPAPQILSTGALARSRELSTPRLKGCLHLPKGRGPIRVEEALTVGH